MGVIEAAGKAVRPPVAPVKEGEGAVLCRVQPVNVHLLPLVDRDHRRRRADRLLHGEESRVRPVSNAAGAVDVPRPLPLRIDDRDKVGFVSDFRDAVHPQWAVPGGGGIARFIGEIFKLQRFGDFGCIRFPVGRPGDLPPIEAAARVGEPGVDPQGLAFKSAAAADRPLLQGEHQAAFRQDAFPDAVGFRAVDQLCCIFGPFGAVGDAGVLGRRHCDKALLPQGGREDPRLLREAGFSQGEGDGLAAVAEAAAQGEGRKGRAAALLGKGDPESRRAGGEPCPREKGGRRGKRCADREETGDDSGPFHGDPSLKIGAPHRLEAVYGRHSQRSEQHNGVLQRDFIRVE